MERGRMIRRASAFSLTLFTLACASSRRAVGPVAPTPASQPSAPAPAPPQAPVAQQASTSKPVDTKPVTDSARLSSNDVNKRMTDLFGGDSAKVSKPTIDSTAAAPVWDIEVHAYESTSQVERYLRMFTGPAKDRIESRLER